MRPPPPAVGRWWSPPQRARATVPRTSPSFRKASPHRKNLPSACKQRGDFFYGHVGAQLAAPPTQRPLTRPRLDGRGLFLRLFGFKDCSFDKKFLIEPVSALAFGMAHDIMAFNAR